jgi:hypothetical protein
LYENEDLYEDGGCIRTRVMRLRAYAYAYGRLYIYGPLDLEIERTNQLNQEVTEPSKVTIPVEIVILEKLDYSI